MEIELDYYGKFVVYNGMQDSCEISQKSADFLLQSLYSILDKQYATEFIFKGLKDYLQEFTENEICEKLQIPSGLIEDSKFANDWVQEQENIMFYKTASILQQKQKKLNHIERYKNLELSRSIIFKHLKSID